MPNTLSALGIVHTVISVIALLAGAVALFRYKELTLHDGAGRVYLGGTLLTAVTGFGIFAHGHATAGHYLGVLTILALITGYVASRGTFGKRSRAIQAASYSLTFLFQLIPGFTETLTRLPAGAPLMSSPEAPFLQKLNPALFLAYLIAVVFQIRYLRRPPVSMTYET
jgi:uncharacterized membrane protein